MLSQLAEILWKAIFVFIFICLIQFLKQTIASGLRVYMHFVARSLVCGIRCMAYLYNIMLRNFHACLMYVCSAILINLGSWLKVKCLSFEVCLLLLFYHWSSAFLNINVGKQIKALWEKSRIIIAKKASETIILKVKHFYLQTCTLLKCKANFLMSTN